MTVARDATLEVDTFGKRYDLLLTVVDTGIPAQTATATLTVNIQDVNNKPPTFPQDSYLTYISERESIGMAHTLYLYM